MEVKSGHFYRAVYELDMKREWYTVLQWSRYAKTGSQVNFSVLLKHKWSCHSLTDVKVVKETHYKNKTHIPNMHVPTSTERENGRCRYFPVWSRQEDLCGQGRYGGNFMKDSDGRKKKSTYLKEYSYSTSKIQRDLILITSQWDTEPLNYEIIFLFSMKAYWGSRTWKNLIQQNLISKITTCIS